MIIKVSKDGTIPLKAFEDIVNIKEVATYSVEEHGKGLAITFYDKEGNKLNPQERRAIDEMRNQDIPIPWQVNRFLDLDGKLPVSGDQASLSKGGDYGTLEDMRNAVEWLANQFGGKVKWE